MDKTEERGKRWEEYIGSYEFISLDECQCPMHNFSPLINLETLNGYKPAKLQSCQNFKFELEIKSESGGKQRNFHLL